jgi:hypothetical protein
VKRKICEPDVGSEFERLWVVIPTAHRHKYLSKIFQASEVRSDQRVLVRTKPGVQIPEAINLEEFEIFNIQYWWNIGIEYAAARGAKYVGVLNDDTDLSHGQLRGMLAQLLEEGTDLCHPDPSETGGWGHCFIIRIDSKVRPDTRFTWWCGDYDLKFQAKKGRGVSIYPFAIPNIHANELTSQDERIQMIIKKDISAFRRKYPIYTVFQEFLPRGIRKLKRKIIRQAA